MKKLLFVFLFAILGLSSAFAQSTATAVTNATVITPISISKVTDLEFGTLAVSSVSAGTVVMAPTSSNSRTPSGGVTLPNVTGTVSAAKFTVTGFGTSTYAITLPSSITLNGTPSGTMTVNSFTSTPSGTGALVGGTQDIYVGATLNVSAAQAAGSYTNPTGLAVTVNYN